MTRALRGLVPAFAMLAALLACAPMPAPAPAPAPASPVETTSAPPATQAAPPPVAPVAAPAAAPVAAPPSPTSAPAPSGPDLLSREVVVAAGQSRTYGLRLPRNHDARRPYPLVFVFHGDGQDGFSLYGNFKFQEASQENAILVYPSGVGATWDLYTPADRNRDVAFVEAILAQLGARHAIDRTRVFASGWSNGGFFANQLACRRSALFRGVASSSGGAPYEPDAPNEKWPSGFTRCPNQAPVPYLAIHGLADRTVDPGGGEFSATYWASVNGCGAARGASAAGLPAPCQSYPACKSGKPVVYCPIAGMGHQIWARAAEVQWAFFRSL